MTANNVLLSIRSRLRDEERRALRFSDEELRIYLELAQNELILEFDCNVKKVRFSCEKSPFRFLNRVLCIYKVTHNNTEIKNLPRPFALKQKDLCFTLLNEQEGELNFKSSGEIEVLCNMGVRILELDDEMFLDEMFFNALVLGVLKRMLLVETSEENLQKYAPYERFYLQEIAKLTLLLNKSQTSKIHFTKFNKC